MLGVSRHVIMMSACRNGDQAHASTPSYSNSGDKREHMLLSNTQSHEGCGGKETVAHGHGMTREVTGLTTSGGLVLDPCTFFWIAANIALSA